MLLPYDEDCIMKMNFWQGFWFNVVKPYTTVQTPLPNETTYSTFSELVAHNAFDSWPTFYGSPCLEFTPRTASSY